MTQLLSVEKAIRSKSPKWAERIPRCVIKYVERLIHQDEMNSFIERHETDTPTEFAQHTLDFLQVTAQVVNEDKFPKEGRYIVVANHPLGGLDGVALIALAGRYRTDVKFPVNDLLMNIHQLSGAFIPINKHGKNSHELVRQFDSAFASDDLIFYFPAGLCSRKQHGVIRDLEWKKTIVTKARQYGRDIIPAFFDAQNSNRFYRIANLRKKLGLKFNVEMALLPDEMFKQKGKTFKVVFGDPIPYGTFDNGRTDVEWAAWLKEQVYGLKLK